MESKKQNEHTKQNKNRLIENKWMFARQKEGPGFGKIGEGD